MASPPTQRSAWQGLVVGKRPTSVSGIPRLALPSFEKSDGKSGAFAAKDTNGTRWWVKPMNNLQDPRILVAEHVVAGIGHIIGAPVCEASIVEVPDSLNGVKLPSGITLQPGYAHATRDIAGAGFSRRLLHRLRDDNRRRHAAVFALYDLCWGQDHQWLTDENDQYKIYSHDHGMYFCNQILMRYRMWTEATLVRNVHDRRWLNLNERGIDKNELVRLSAELRNLQLNDLLDILCAIPVQWHATDDELECLGWFIAARANDVADRLDHLRSQI